MEITLKVAE